MATHGYGGKVADWYVQRIPDIPKPTVRVPERLPRNVFSLPIWWIVRVQELKELKLGGGFNPFEKY